MLSIKRKQRSSIDSTMVDAQDKSSPPPSKLDTLVDAAAAAAKVGSVACDVEGLPQPPSEVTPANTFESAASASNKTATANEPKPPAKVAAADDKLKKKDNKVCPWKNRSDLIALWKKRFEQLAAYHAEHGHSNVPQRYAENPELGRWVKDQRAFRRNNKLSRERIELLDSLGFVWKVKRPDDFWTDKLNELRRYKVQNGHANPPREGEWKLLACWVDRQRRAGKKGKLTTERVRLLNEVGLEWNPRGNSGNEGIVACDAKGNQSSQLGPISTSESCGAISGTTKPQAAASFPHQYPNMGGPDMHGIYPQSFQDPSMMQSRMVQMGSGMNMQMSTMSHQSMMGGQGMNYLMMSQINPNAPFPSQQSGSAMSGNSMPSDNMPEQLNQVPQGSSSFLNNLPMQGQTMPGYVPDHIPGYNVYPNKSNIMSATSAFHQPNQHMRSYPFVSDERQASMSRLHQLRIMLAEEEERQASITRTQKLRAMLAEEEGRLGYYGGGSRFGYYNEDQGIMSHQQQQMMMSQQQQQQMMSQPQGQQQQHGGKMSQDQLKHDGQIHLSQDQQHQVQMAPKTPNPTRETDNEPKQDSNET